MQEMYINYLESLLFSTDHILLAEGMKICDISLFDIHVQKCICKWKVHNGKIEIISFVVMFCSSLSILRCRSRYETDLAVSVVSFFINENINELRTNIIPQTVCLTFNIKDEC